MRLFILLLSLLPTLCWAQVEVQNLRVWPAPDNTRLVFDVSGPLKYQVFTMSNPDRVVIDMVQSRAAPGLKSPSGNLNLLRGMRFGQRDNGDLRVYYGVTYDGMHGPWQEFAGEEE